MKSSLLVLVSVLSLFVINVITPGLPSVTGNQEYSGPVERTSRELLIGWKAGVSDAERDRIIEELGGKLNHRFSLIKADSVLFDSVSASQSALAAVASHNSVEAVEMVEQSNCGGSRPLSDTHSHTFAESEIETFTSSTSEVNQSGNSDAYTRRFPNASWRHVDYVAEAQEFAAQKQEVIIAVISDQPQDSDYPFYDSSLLRPVLWENTVEKRGLPGVDDDNNGYVDDIHGIDTIHIPNEGRSLSNGIINLIAGIANYDPDRLTNLAGKMKLMLITAYHEVDVDSECGVNDPNVRTTNAALIEALEYAVNMGAKVAFVSGHYTYKKSLLVIAAAAAFPGLIIVPSDRDWDQECFGDTSMLLHAGLNNVIGVGTASDNKMAFSYGGKVDLLASITYESPFYAGNEGGVVAGATAHLMSCYPELDRKQIKELLLSSTDRITDRRSMQWHGNDIRQLKNGRWRNLGYDAPSFIFYDTSYSVVWANDQKKSLFVSWENNSASRLFTWQYSGAIAPTWIDNLILPQSDYSGDGKADPALWHPGTGEFCLQNGTVATLGKWGDTPAPGDYDGDGSIDFVVCRRLPDRKMYEPDDGPLEWIFTDKKLILGRFYDIPVPTDYDGDGKTDIAVFRKDTAQWIFQDKKKNTKFGNPADLPVPADYDGDGRVELATYTPLTSTWHIQGIGHIQYGKPGDSPVPADYDGDGRADIATWNPRTRQWLVRDWSNGGNMIKQRIGSKWDIPVPGDYDGDGKVELATFNPITARWNIQGRAPFTFGTAGDVPLVRGN